MNGDFFVMLTTQNGDYLPLIDKYGDIAKFNTANAARDSAKNNPLGENFGYEIFERGCGVV
jgi:hypothetical protein